MEAFSNYLLQNWALILILLAFVIMLRITVFLDKKTVMRMYILIAAVFLLSIIVFVEFYLVGLGGYATARTIMMAIRYSATPIIIAFVLFTLVNKARWYVFIPSLVLTIVNIVSIFTGIVFSIDDDGNLVRGFLGYLPYIVVGLYCIFLVYVLIKHSNKQATEIIPIIFMCFAFVSGLVLPFILGKSYSVIFCTTIAIALFVYYVFQILQLTKKDPLTGLLNRQAYYSMVKNNAKEITAIISIDMNGLKVINDTGGHAAGDKALTTLAFCFTKATKFKQSIYRIGGDEFVIVCRKTSEQDVKELIDCIYQYVSETKYSCSIGYCCLSDSALTVEEMLRQSDEMMYQVKAEYYEKIENDR